MENYNLGLKLKSRRKELHLTLVELSKLAGVHHSYLWRIENGLRFPSARTLRKMAKPLGYEVMELLKLAGYLSPDETDERIDTLRELMKGEIKTAMSILLEKVDTL